MTQLSPQAIDAIFREARTFNHYTDEPVGPDDLRAVWDLMKWGPTSANQQPVRLVWCVSQEAKDKLAACCSAQNAPKIRQAPATVIVGMDTEFHENLPEFYPHADARAWFDGNLPLRLESAMRNSTLQGAYLIIAARALGLDCGPMSGFDNGKVDAAFFHDTPAVRSNFIATIGHGDRATLHDRLPRAAFERFNTIA